MIELELPNDFIHDAPTGYSYSVSEFKPNILSYFSFKRHIFSHYNKFLRKTIIYEEKPIIS